MLAASQTVIGHLSALGAHRVRLAESQAARTTLATSVAHIADAWEHMGNALVRGDTISGNTREAALCYDALAELSDDIDPATRRAAHLLQLLFDELAVLRAIATRLIA